MKYLPSIIIVFNTFFTDNVILLSTNEICSFSRQNNGIKTI